MQRGDIIVAPMRVGVGYQIGVSLGYLKFSDSPGWSLFKPLICRFEKRVQFDRQFVGLAGREKMSAGIFVHIRRIVK